MTITLTEQRNISIGAPRAQVKAEDAKQKILDHLAKVGSVGSANILARALSARRETTLLALREMTESGQVKKTELGYSLPGFVYPEVNDKIMRELLGL